MPHSCKTILDKMVYKGAMTESERDKILRNLKTDLVMCGECIYHDVFGRTTKYYGCKYYGIAVDADHFCKKGERRKTQ